MKNALLPIRDADTDADSDKTEQYDEDLYVSDYPAYWHSSSGAHKLAAVTSSFSYIVEEKTHIDVGILSTHPSVRARYVDQSNMLPEQATLSEKEQVDLQQCHRLIQLKKTRRKVKSRKEASVQDLRQYWNEFASAKQAEYKSWVENEVFTFVDMRKQNRQMGTDVKM